MTCRHLPLLSYDAVVKKSPTGQAFFPFNSNLLSLNEFRPGKQVKAYGYTCIFPSFLRTNHFGDSFFATLDHEILS